MTPARRAPGLVRARQAVAVLIAGLVLVMAVIAGRSDRLFGSWDITVHGVLGNIVFTLAVVAVVLAVVGRAGPVAVTASVVFVALAFAQVGLGYVGRESLGAAAWHIPGGVLLMGIAGFQLGDVFRPRPATGAAQTG